MDAYNRTVVDQREQDRQEERKQLKRAANRKSAQLSRQRKKQYIEDLAREHSTLKVRASVHTNQPNANPVHP